MDLAREIETLTNGRNQLIQRHSALQAEVQNIERLILKHTGAIEAFQQLAERIRADEDPQAVS